MYLSVWGKMRTSEHSPHAHSVSFLWFM